MIRILIVDDQDMIRAGLRAILSSDPRLGVVADVGDAFAALDILQETAVDVVLMDIRMPGIDGVEATSRIRARFTAEQLAVIILTTFEQDANVLAALRAGANGFLGKGVAPAALIGGIIDVVEGGGILSAAAAAATISAFAEAPARQVDEEMAERFTALTPRERDVVVAIARGLSNEDIGREMFVSPYTVKTHANRAMSKVGARDRAQLVAFAYRAGLADEKRSSS